MKFISYSQNFEDVMLWRALKHIKTGFYIDVGANDSKIDSVTKAFYDRGWHGVNIEPVSYWHDKLLKERPKDINLKIAAGAHKGSIVIYDIPGTGMSTSSKSIAEEHERIRNFKINTIKVSQDTLTTIIKNCEYKDIHFLKIDVEGAEKSVIQGLDMQKIRPWIIVVESFLPARPIECHEEWEGNILSANYIFAFSDGLNRFYVAEEKSELLDSFHYPANVFDEFIHNRQIEAESRLQQAESRLQQAESRLQQAESRLQQAESRLQQERQHAEQINLQLQAVFNSSSWRMTLPIRYLGKAVKLSVRGGIAWLTLKPESRPVRTLRFGLINLSHWVSLRPRIKATLLFFIQPSSNLANLLRRFLSPENSLNPSFFTINESPPSDRFQEIYYYFVDHTIGFHANSGVQRVVRMVARGLVELGVNIRFVKWSSSNNSLVLINLKELEALSKWNGPVLSPLEAYRYKFKEKSIPRPSSLNDSWLIIPEVTHHSNSLPSARHLFDEAKRLGLKKASIFYDDIPKYRPELNFIKQTHNNYMRELLRTDVVFSISQWSNDDLLSFATKMGEKHDPDWAISLPLPAQSILGDRVTDIDNSFKDNKFILSVGSITPHKNQLTLIRAFLSYCGKNKTDWKLLLVGHLSAESSTEIKTLTDKSKNILLVGGCSDSRLRELYLSCSFTVFPSLIEGYGLPIVESLWFGKPCIGSNIGAMAELSGKPGFIAVDTTNADALENAISAFIENPEYLRKHCQDAIDSELSTWEQYNKELIGELQIRGMQMSESVPKHQRIFWLGAHKLLIETELQRLRALGYEVFNPAYLSAIEDQSVNKEWDDQQLSTLPPSIFKKLSEYNFFYNEISEEISEILNLYFGSVIVTCSPAWVAPIVKNFCGKVIFRTYGQHYLMSEQLQNIGLRTYIENNRKFTFMPFAIESLEDESDWLVKNCIVVPYCVDETILEFADTWQNYKGHRFEIALTCPNITNPYFAEHYKFLKENFNEPHFKFYGVQLDELTDPQLVGTLDRQELINRFQHCAGYLYTYSDRVCYLPPVEIMLLGGPVLFLKGSLLDKFFPDGAPGRCHTVEEAKAKVDRLLKQDEKFIRLLIDSQLHVRERYHPKYVWQEFDRAINKLLPLQLSSRRGA